MVVLIRQLYVIQSLERFQVVMKTADESRDEEFELHLLESLSLLEENGLNIVLKVEQRKAIKQLFEKKDLLAVLPTCYGKSLIFQLLVLLARAEDETACLLGYNPTLKHN